MAGTIPDYPPPARALDGTEPVAGWQDGQQRAIPISDITVFASDIAAAAARASEQNAAGYAAQAQANAVFISRDVSTGFALVLGADADGNAALGVRTDGTTVIGVAEIRRLVLSALMLPGGTVGVDVPPGYGVALAMDADGAMVAGVTTDGVLSAGAARFASVNGITGASLSRLASGKTAGARRYVAEVMHILSYGQSLSIGVSNAAISNSACSDCLRFNGGVRPLDTDASTARTSLVPLTEQTKVAPVQNDGAGQAGETPVWGCAAMVKALILSEDGISPDQQSYQLLGSAPGHGGHTVAQLSKGNGSGDYQVLADDLTRGAALAAAAGKTYAVGAICWTQGEQDYSYGTTADAYTASLTQLISDMRADAVAASGQAVAPPVIGYQVGSHKTTGAAYPSIALAQLALTDANAAYSVACPMYWADYSDGNFHLTAESSRKMGAYYGIAYKRVAIDGGTFTPLRPVASLRQGPIALITFHVPVGALALDTMQVAATTNSGFQLVDANGAALGISSVTLVDADKVKIVAAAPIPAGARLQYAFVGDGGGNVGRTTGPRGNLRDSQGDEITFMGARMDNWCVIFDLAL